MKELKGVNKTVNKMSDMESLKDARIPSKGQSSSHIAHKTDSLENGRGQKSRSRDKKQDQMEGMTLSEENLLLRRHLRKQEEKIKLLATKLVRIVSERRGKEKRDEILIEEQKTRISNLERQIQIVTDKLSVSRQQLQSYTKLIPHINIVSGPSKSYSVVGASTTKSTSALSTSKSIKKAASARPSSTRASTALDHEFTTRVEQLLLEAKAENQALEDQLRVTRERLLITEREGEKLKDKLKEKETGHQEELLKLRGQMDLEADRTKKKRTLSDNIQLIRLQRESRRTASWLSTMEAQCRSLESTLTNANETISHLESEVASLQDELRESSQKSLGLQKDLEDSSGQLNRLREVETALKGLQEENSIIKQTNETFLEKTLSSASLRRSESDLDEQRTLRTRISQLEKEINDKSGIEAALNLEQTRTKELRDKIKILENNLADFKSDGPKPSTSTSSTSTEVEHDPISTPSESTVMNKTKIESLEIALSDIENELTTTQTQLVQVRDELQKTRCLLKTQIGINGECQREMEILTNKLDQAESGHGEKLRQFMTLLEQRTNQMTALEATLETLSKDGSLSKISQEGDNPKKKNDENENPQGGQEDTVDKDKDKTEEDIPLVFNRN